jgi:hypothetical protein
LIFNHRAIALASWTAAVLCRFPITFGNGERDRPGRRVRRLAGNQLITMAPSKPFQTVPRYSKAFQAFFRRKKIVYFLGLAALLVVAAGESTQINPPILECKPKANRCKPKNESTITFIEPWTLFPLAVCHASVQF